MDIDFIEQYKNYATADLLKIINKPGSYQQAAVDAALKVLSTRTILPEDTVQAEKYLQEADDSNIKAAQKKLDFKSILLGFFEPLLKPKEKATPEQWFRLVLFFVTLRYGWFLFNAIRWWHVNYHAFTNIGWRAAPEANVLIILCVPIILFLVYKKKKLGWILLFSRELFVLLINLSTAKVFFKYLDVFYGSTFNFLCGIIIPALFVWMLWKTAVVVTFGVTNKAKKITLIAAATFAGLNILFSYLI